MRRQYFLVQLAFIEPRDEDREGIRLFVIEVDELIRCLGEAIIESSTEVCGTFAKQLLVDVEGLGVFSQADDDLGSGISGDGISVKVVSNDPSARISSIERADCNLQK